MLPTRSIGLFLAIMSFSACAAQSGCLSINSLMGEVESIRGLSFKHPVQCQALSSGEIKQRIARSLKKKQMLVEHEGRIYRLLGVIPDKLKYDEFIAEEYGNVAGGYYDPESDTLFTLKSDPVERQQTVMVHELTHALQDQYIELDEFLSDELSSDMLAARTALVEGEANAVSYLHQKHLRCTHLDAGRIAQHLARRKVSVPTSESVALRAMMDFPYFFGLDFVCRYVNSGDFAQLNQLFRQPPRSSREILQPNSAAEFSLPSVDDLHRAIADFESPNLRSASAVDTDVLGQFFVMALFANFLPVELAVELAEGWRGDLLFYEKLDRSQSNVIEESLVWVTRWSSVDRAEQFIDAYRTVWSLNTPLKSELKTRVRGADGEIFIQRRR